MWVYIWVDFGLILPAGWWKTNRIENPGGRYKSLCCCRWNADGGSALYSGMAHENVEPHMVSNSGFNHHVCTCAAIALPALLCFCNHNDLLYLISFVFGQERFHQDNPKIWNITKHNKTLPIKAGCGWISVGLAMVSTRIDWDSSNFWSLHWVGCPLVQRSCSEHGCNIAGQQHMVA